MECQQRYLALPARAQQWIATSYSRSAAAQWVLSSNRIEGLGTQDEATTVELVEEYFAQVDGASASAAATAADATTSCPSAVPTPSPPAASDVAIKRKETVETVAALSLLFSELQEMTATEERDRLEHPPAAGSVVKFGPNDVLLLSTEMVCRAHEVLMKGMMRRALHGQRLRQAGEDLWAGSTLFPNRSHVYPPGGDVASLLSTVLNQYADNVSRLGDLHTVQHTTQLFMLAAWLLFKLVDMHPFVDGNGRIGRLLADRVLRLIFPFPVPIHAVTIGTEDPSRIKVNMDLVVEDLVIRPQPYVQLVTVAGLRQLYLVLLQACRHRPVAKDQPMELAALLVENGWLHWHDAPTSVPPELLLPYDLIGRMLVCIPPLPLVRGKRKVPQSLAESIQARYRGLDHLLRRGVWSEADWPHEVDSVLQRVRQVEEQLRRRDRKSMEFEHEVADGVHCRILVQLRG